MGMKKIVDGLASFLSGEASKQMNKTISKTLEKTEKEIEHLTIKALKASTVFILIFIGLVFALVGLANYLTAAFMFEEGIGFLIVGLALVLLGWFAKSVR